MRVRKDSDRRLRKVLVALAAAQKYDDTRRARGEEVREGEVDYVVGRCMFEKILDDWPADRMRALVTLACQLAPADTLETWAKEAEEFLVDHEKYAREQAEEEAVAASSACAQNDNNAKAA